MALRDSSNPSLIVPNVLPGARIFLAARRVRRRRRLLPDHRSGASPLVQVSQALDAATISLQRDGFGIFLHTIVRYAVGIAGAAAGWLGLQSAEGRHEIVGAIRRETPDGRRAAVERVPVRFGPMTFGHLVLVFGDRAGLAETHLRAMRVLAQQAAVAIAMQRLRERACEAARRSALEAERARMAGEIHDGVAQAFLAIMMQARVAQLPARRPQHGSVLRSLKAIESLAVNGLENARRSVFALRPMPVERHGLVPALEKLLVSLTIPGGTRFVFVNRAATAKLSAGTEDATYRIVQEAVQNALKHAGASSVMVSLELHEDQLRVCVEDDGNGIPQEMLQRMRRGGGLQALRERAERCGGSVVVEPSSQRGTRVEVILPLQLPAP